MVTTIVVVLVCLIMMVILFVLLTPVRITVDTVAKDFNIRMKGFFKLELLLDEEQLFSLKLHVLNKEIDVEPLQQKAQTKGMKYLRQSRQLAKSYNWPGKLKELMKAFHIRRLYLDMDTGDVIANAWLHPLFYGLSADEKFFHVNYLGREQFIFEAQTRAILLLYRFVK